MQEREAVALFHDFLKFFTANFDTFVTDAESKYLSSVIVMCVCVCARGRATEGKYV